MGSEGRITDASISEQEIGVIDERSSLKRTWIRKDEGLWAGHQEQALNSPCQWVYYHSQMKKYIYLSHIITIYWLHFVSSWSHIPPWWFL